MNTIACEVDGSLATVHFRRPDVRNALNVQMANELYDCLLNLNQADHVRAVVLTGSGGAFCAGGDIADMRNTRPRQPQQVLESMSHYTRICRLFMSMDKPVVAAVDGAAFGA